MKTILITGADGSGKSTIFNRIKNEKITGVSLLQVPHFDLTLFDDSPEFLYHAQVINQMSENADVHEQRIMKGLALFGSMLLFHQAANIITSANTRMLFCERHPMIDARVYASFYAGQLKEVAVAESKLQLLEEKYRRTFNYLGSFLPAFEGSVVKHILETIQKYFGDIPADLSAIATLFNVSLPHQIYYLTAPAEILYERISSRKSLEPHETLTSLSNIQRAYSKVLNELPKQVHISTIDASGFGQLDLFYQQLISETSSK